MGSVIVWSAIFFLFLLEGTIVQWLIPSSPESMIQLSSHFVLVSVLYVAIYWKGHKALWGGMVFGLLQDLVYYGHMLGLHSFCMGLTGYLAELFHRNRPYLFFPVFNTIALSLFFYEGLVNTLYRMANVVPLSLGWSLTWVILPSILLNCLFALLIYLPARNWLYVENKENKEEAEQ